MQTHSHQLARLQACSAILHTHDRLLDLDSPHASKYFTAVNPDKRFNVSSASGEALREIIELVRPRVLVANANRLTNNPIISKICRAAGLHIIADMTETAGLVASGLAPRPFEHADIVVAGTQGSLRGPSGALIFSRKGSVVMPPGSKNAQEWCSLGEAVHQSVFPGHQGGPHNHAITAMAVALGQAATPSFKKYQETVLKNAQALADRLRDFGYRLDLTVPASHRIMMDLGSVDARQVNRVLDAIGIVTGPVSDNRLHFGTLAMSSRGLLPQDFRLVAEIIHESVVMVQDTNNGRSRSGSALETVNLNNCIMDGPNILKIRRKVRNMTEQFAVVVG
ncbi:cytosolic hydroxymethyltransferase, putative [Metarhizium acridum CQMa 102]|uniref:Glycine hydroxymethyltransferase n=1 Tax=Metarhizium acridum (strain CQMa 102) TaxID=655827 RepID=E9E6U3_METAQ|nr:cytosolic hydroxymethyltransferase, putative [Metarhizium acridum CQMa 102]EFY88382.1 cytosolic hydroxymethyltransferase, putative [Metarhizium acridum CQMa 102]